MLKETMETFVGVQTHTTKDYDSDTLTTATGSCLEILT